MSPTNERVLPLWAWFEGLAKAIMAIPIFIGLVPLMCVGFGDHSSGDRTYAGPPTSQLPKAAARGEVVTMPQRVGQPLRGAEALRVLDEWKMNRNAGNRFVFKVTRIVYLGDGSIGSVSAGQFRLLGPNSCSLELEEAHSHLNHQDAQSKRVIWTFDHNTLRVDWPNVRTHLEYTQRAEDKWFLDFIPVKWLLGVDTDDIMTNWDIIVVRATVPAGVNPHTGVVVHTPYMAYHIKALPQPTRPNEYLCSIEVSLDVDTFLPKTVVIDAATGGPIFYQFELIEASQNVSPCSPVDRTRRKRCRNRDLVSRLKLGVDRCRIAHQFRCGESLGKN